MFALVNSLDAAGFASSPIAKMLSELRKFGANGHLYIPGIGAISGITAGNYLDSIGTTNASVDGNVGLVLDGAGTTGPELALPLVPANWAVINTDATHLVTWGAGSFRYQCDTFSPSLTVQKSGLLTVGKAYKVEITVTAYVSGSLKSDSSLGIIVNGLGKFSFTIVAANQSFNLYRNAAVTDLTVSGISIKEVTGIHATQATTGYQPKLRRGLVNYQLNSVPIGGQWVAEATGTGVVPTVTYNYATAPDGSSAARAILDKGAGATSADLSQFRAGNSTVVSGAPYTSAIWLRTTVEGATAAVSLRDNITASTLIVTDQWQLFVRSGNAISSIMSVGVRLRPSEATSAQADILVGCAGIFQGVLTAQQIIAAGGIPVTTSAHASSSSGAYKWDFSTDDYLAQSSAPFGFADDHYIAAAGVCNASAGVISTLASVGGSAAGHVSLDLLNGLVRANWTGSAQILSTLPAPDGIPFVASLTKIGNTGKVSKNGVKAAGVDLTSVVAVTTTVGAIGARCLTTLSSFHNGSIFGEVEINGTVSDAQDLIFQRGLNAVAQYAAGRF